MTGLNILFTNFTKICALCGFLFLSSSAWADLKFDEGDMEDLFEFFVVDMMLKLKYEEDRFWNFVARTDADTNIKSCKRSTTYLSMITIGPNPNTEFTIGSGGIKIQGLPGGDSINLATPEMGSSVVSDNQFLKRFTSVTMGKTTFNRQVTGGGTPSIEESGMSLILKSSNFELVDPRALLHKY